MSKRKLIHGRPKRDRVDANPGERPDAGLRRTLLELAAVAVVAVVVRAMYFWQLRGTLPFETLILDGRAYDEWAQRIAGGDWIGSEVFYQAPLYPYLLGLIYAVAGHQAVLVRVIQAALSVSSCLLLAWAGRRFIDPRTGLIAGLLLAVYPPALFFDSIVQKAALDLWLMSLLLALVGEVVHKRGWPWVFGAGIALGALALNRENALLVLPVVALWLWWYFNDAARGQRAVLVGALLAGVAAVLAPVGLRNYRVGGEFLLTTSQYGPNFYIGNHAGASGRYEPLLPHRADPRFERADATRLAEEAAGHPLSPAAVSGYWMARSLEEISAHPLDWLRLLAWKLFMVVHARELVDGEGLDAYSDFSSVLRVLGYVLSFGTILPLAIVGAWATRAQWRKLMILYALVLCLVGSIAIFYVFARYRFTFVPIVLLFAAAALDATGQIVAAWRASSLWRNLGPGLVAAALAAVIGNVPLADTGERAMTYLNLGMGLLSDGRPKDAVEPLRKAIAIKPNLAGAYHNLGRSLTLTGRPDEAVEYYQFALRQAPDFGPAHAALGQYYFEKQQADQAIPHLRQAVAMLPQSPLLHVELAELLTQRGEGAEAVRQLRAGLQANPQSWLCANNLAWELATNAEDNVRDPAAALTIAEDLAGRELRPDQPRLAPEHEAAILDTLAAARAAVGQYDKAVTATQRALETVGSVADHELERIWLMCSGSRNGGCSCGIRFR